MKTRPTRDEQVEHALDVADSALDLAQELAAMLLDPRGGALPRAWIAYAEHAFKKTRALVVAARGLPRPGRRPGARR